MHMLKPISLFQHLTVNSGTVPLHVKQFGEGELVVFLHGFPECGYSWRHVISELGVGFLSVAPDCRGYGHSGKPSAISDYTMDKVCGDVLALLAHYGQQQCTLVGHDWGGVAAWYFSAKFPQHIRRLVVVNAPHPNLFQQALDIDPEQRAASQYITRLRDPLCEERLLNLGLQQLWSNMFGDLEARALLSSGDKAVYLNAWSQPGALTGMLNWYRAAPFVVPSPEQELVAQHDAAMEQIFVAAPTMLIWGTQDTVLLPGLLKGLGRYVTKLRIEQIAEAGHGVIHEAPTQVAALIRDFIKSS